MVKVIGMVPNKFTNRRGAPGVDKMTAYEVEQWFNQYKLKLFNR